MTSVEDEFFEIPGFTPPVTLALADEFPDDDGDEICDIVFHCRGKLYRFVEADAESPQPDRWIERATGYLQLLRDKQGIVTCVFRQARAHTVAANFLVSHNPPYNEISFHENHETTLCFTVQDFSDGDMHVVIFSLRLASKELAESLIRCFDQAKTTSESKKLKCVSMIPEDDKRPEDDVNLMYDKTFTTPIEQATRMDAHARSDSESEEEEVGGGWFSRNDASIEEEIDGPPGFVPPVTLEILPDVVLEESEEVLHEQHLRVYTFDPIKESWKERGVGVGKFLRNPETGDIRFLLRNEKTFRLIANFKITRDEMYNDLQLNANPKVMVCRIANSLVNDKGEKETDQLIYAFKFKTEDEANRFKKDFDDVKQLAVPENFDTCSEMSDNERTLKRTRRSSIALVKKTFEANASTRRKSLVESRKSFSHAQLEKIKSLHDKERTTGTEEHRVNKETNPNLRKQPTAKSSVSPSKDTPMARLPPQSFAYVHDQSDIVRAAHARQRRQSIKKKVRDQMMASSSSEPPPYAYNQRHRRAAVPEISSTGLAAAASLSSTPDAKRDDKKSEDEKRGRKPMDATYAASTLVSERPGDNSKLPRGQGQGQGQASVVEKGQGGGEGAGINTQVDAVAAGRGRENEENARQGGEERKKRPSGKDNMGGPFFTPYPEAKKSHTLGNDSALMSTSSSVLPGPANSSETPNSRRKNNNSYQAEAFSTQNDKCPSKEGGKAVTTVRKANNEILPYSIKRKENNDNNGFCPPRAFNSDRHRHKDSFEEGKESSSDSLKRIKRDLEEQRKANNTVQAKNVESRGAHQGAQLRSRSPRARVQQDPNRTDALSSAINDQASSVEKKMRTLIHTLFNDQKSSIEKQQSWFREEWRDHRQRFVKAQVNTMEEYKREMKEFVENALKEMKELYSESIKEMKHEYSESIREMKHEYSESIRELKELLQKSSSMSSPKNGQSSAVTTSSSFCFRTSPQPPFLTTTATTTTRRQPLQGTAGVTPTGRTRTGSGVGGFEKEKEKNVGGEQEHQQQLNNEQSLGIPSSTKQQHHHQEQLRMGSGARVHNTQTPSTSSFNGGQEHQERQQPQQGRLIGAPLRRSRSEPRAQKCRSRSPAHSDTDNDNPLTKGGKGALRTETTTSQRSWRNDKHARTQGGAPHNSPSHDSETRFSPQSPRTHEQRTSRPPHELTDEYNISPSKKKSKMMISSSSRAILPTGANSMADDYSSKFPRWKDDDDGLRNHPPSGRHPPSSGDAPAPAPDAGAYPRRTSPGDKLKERQQQQQQFASSSPSVPSSHTLGPSSRPCESGHHEDGSSVSSTSCMPQHSVTSSSHDDHRKGIQRHGSNCSTESEKKGLWELLPAKKEHDNNVHSETRRIGMGEKRIGRAWTHDGSSCARPAVGGPYTSEKERERRGVGGQSLNDNGNGQHALPSACPNEEEEREREKRRNGRSERNERSERSVNDPSGHNPRTFTGHTHTRTAASSNSSAHYAGLGRDIQRTGRAENASHLRRGGLQEGENVKSTPKKRDISEVERGGDKEGGTSSQEEEPSAQRARRYFNDLESKSRSKPATPAVSRRNL